MIYLQIDEARTSSAVHMFAVLSGFGASWTFNAAGSYDVMM